MFAVTHGSAIHSRKIMQWEERVIACGMTPIIYDLGGLGFGTPSLASPNRPGTIQKAMSDLGGSFVFTDPDAVFCGFPSQLIGDWTAAVTVRPPSSWSKSERIDAGVMYFSSGPDCEEFINLWLSFTKRVVNDENALNMLLKNIGRNDIVELRSAGCEIKIKGLPTELYNCKDKEGMKRSVIARVGNMYHEQVKEVCGLTSNFVNPNSVYETFTDDIGFQIDQFVKEKDSPLPESNVLTGIYEGHDEAVIVSCFYNPQNNPYRLIAFQKFFRSIKHLNFRIVECLIGKNAKPQLPNHANIKRVYADDLIWHKETLLNMAVTDLPPEYKYVFIVDTDVLFTNPKWIVESVKVLQQVGVLQPFEYCVHLDKNQLKPSFDTQQYEAIASDRHKRHPSMWRSFSSNIALDNPYGRDTCYDVHGHVGFAWGFRREVLEECPLFEKALIGGADHILAHAAVCDLPHPCITKSFTENLGEVLEWSFQFYKASGGSVGYVDGYLYHIWHGDVALRDYFNRIKQFTGPSKSFVKGENGLYKLPPQNKAYINKYYKNREVAFDAFDWIDPSFFEDMGYMLWDMYWLFGEPSYDEQTVQSDDLSTDQMPDTNIDFSQNSSQEPAESTQSSGDNGNFS